jgi:undecaprenyl-diphosphatase
LLAGLRELDLRALEALYGGASGAWGPVMVALTILGNGWTAFALLPATVLRRSRRFAVALGLAIAAQAILVWWLKAVVGRVRPWIALGLPTPFGAPHDGSFPSGHAAGSFCFAAFLAVTLPSLWPGRSGLARACVGCAVVLAAFVASSRVYLGAHFPSDVVFGAALGALVGAAGGGAYVRASRARQPEAPVEPAPERG